MDLFHFMPTRLQFYGQTAERKHTYEGQRTPLSETLSWQQVRLTAMPSQFVCNDVQIIVNILEPFFNLWTAHVTRGFGRIILRPA